MTPEPEAGLAQYHSVKRVWAGQITEVVASGCYVREANGEAVLRFYQPGMTARYTPVVGDQSARGVRGRLHADRGAKVSVIQAGALETQERLLDPSKTPPRVAVVLAQHLLPVQ